MEGDEAVQSLRGRGQKHIKKRSLKNKALSLSFNEKDLKDYVTGFHKRKKKRRKEANLKLEEAERRKRIELRKKRKLERQLVYGGAPEDSGEGPDECDEDPEQEQESEPITSVSGTTTYDNGGLSVTVTTREISHEEEHLIERPNAAVLPSFSEAAEKKHPNVRVNKKKPFKRVAKRRSRPKTQNKRDKKKGKKKNNQH